MKNPNAVTAHFGGERIPGTLTALEGAGGYVRLRLNWQDAPLRPAAGMECSLEMHDGARFRFAVLEELETAPGGRSGEFRLKLLGR